MKANRFNFRAWEKPFKDETFEFKGKMHHSVFDEQEGEKRLVTIASFYHDSCWRYKDFTMMQSTGLTDKNGKEIFEGDVMCVLERDWMSGDYTNQTPMEYMIDISAVSVVEWEGGRFILNRIKGHYHNRNIIVSCKRDLFHIIGNIYENPELLKEQ